MFPNDECVQKTLKTLINYEVLTFIRNYYYNFVVGDWKVRCFTLIKYDEHSSILCDIHNSTNFKENKILNRLVSYMSGKRDLNAV